MTRPSARQRGYSTAWDKAAATFKARHPYCLGCQAVGRISPTEVVDHVEPHKGNQAKFWNTALWQPACNDHHNGVKKELERRFALGQATVADLWLDSPMAIAMSRQWLRSVIGADGWPMG